MGATSNTNDFITKARIIHGALYDYSNVVYIKAIEKVEIICKKHGIFKQQPNNHLTGYGCKQCSVENIALGRMNEVSYFIKKANSIYNNKYDYSLVVKGKNTTPVSIICPIHGLFKQPPIRHLFGKGCNKCGQLSGHKKQTFSLDEWICKANSVHNNHYDYSKVIYVNKNTRINIICKLHGQFTQIPHNHLYKNGCPTCAKITQNYAYYKTIDPDSNRIPCALYILKLENAEEKFFKIGISTNLQGRFFEINALYTNTILKTFHYSLQKCISIEQLILKKLKRHAYQPKNKFGGYKECLSINPTSETLKYINAL